MEKVTCKICGEDITEGVQEYVGEFDYGSCFVCSYCYIRYDDYELIKKVK